jgi:hypothetical protein
LTWPHPGHLYQLRWSFFIVYLIGNISVIQLSSLILKNSTLSAAFEKPK